MGINPSGKMAKKSGKSGKFMKKGKIVIVLRGRYAGRKAVILDVNEKGTPERKYPHCTVVGINRHPKKVTRDHSKAAIAKRIKLKPFVKHINLNHLMPTRYTASEELGCATFQKKIEKQNETSEADCLSNPDFRTELRKTIKKSFEDVYRGHNINGDDVKLKFFFRRLRF